MNINNILYCILGGLSFVVIILFFLCPSKTKKEEKKDDKKPEVDKNGYSYNFWRSVALIIGALGVLFWISRLSGLDVVVMDFVAGHKVLMMVFGLVTATYILTFSLLSSPDWKWYGKLIRKLSGWAIIILLGYMTFSYCGCSMSWLHKLGLFNPTLASRQPVEVAPDGTISIIYKPEYIRQEINLDLLPGKKYKVYLSSYMKWKNFEKEKGKRYTKKYNVPVNGLSWSTGAWRKLYGSATDDYPVKDPDSGFSGVVANVDGCGKWIRNKKVLKGKKLLFITLNDNQKEIAFQKYEGIMQITFVPQ